MDASTIFSLTSVFRIAAPELTLVAFACAVLLGGVCKPMKAVSAFIGLVGFAAAGAILVWSQVDPATLEPTVSTLWPDSLALFVRVTALAGGAVLLLMSYDELPEAGAAEYIACLLILSAGVGLCGAAAELVTLFLALELVSIPTYLMLYLPRGGQPVRESAVKYFVLSIFSSAMLLFGFSYLYGVTGTTNIAAIHEALSHGDRLPNLVLVAAVLVIAGLGFRVTAVPFHFYAPDVYEGTANGPAAMLAFAPKAAGFAVLVRLLGFVGPGPASNALAFDPKLPLLLWILAAITMTFGNVVALWQDNLRRLFAYSGIAHSGYMLIGLAVAPYQAADPTRANVAVTALLFYLVAYGAMTIGAFAILQAVSTRDREANQVDDLAGLGTTHPGYALLMTLFLFSLIGLPLTAGFAGKFLLFIGAISAQTPDWLFKWLAVIGAVNSAIGAYYYLRIIGVMYLRGALKPLVGRASAAGLVGLWACAGVTIWLGCYPMFGYKFAREAGTAVRPGLQRAAR